MKVLITGIAGFIGYHTAVKFKQLGHDVVGIDNFNNYYDPLLKYARSAELTTIGVDVRALDLTDRKRVNSFVSGFAPDLVIHLAAMAGVRYSMDHAFDYIEANVNGTQNLIDAIVDAGVQDVIYASTSCVMHGNPLPWNEHDKLGVQLNPYGYTKQTNENQFHVADIRRAVGLRFFTVYGPLGRPDMALFKFTQQILDDQPITVYNYGKMKRDFTYIDDIVNGIVLVSQNMSKRDIYCIGNGTQVNLTDFIAEIEKNLGKKGKYVFKPKHPADATETWADTTKISKLGYVAQTPIDQGVKKFIDWYKDFYL